jgi:hypothetical protein
MYHFTLEGMECRCDTAEELRAICEDRSTRFVATSPKETTASEDGATRETVATEMATTESPSRRLHRAVARRVFPEQGDIAALPFVEGGLSWTKVKKVGKKLGRTDYRQLRSDLFKRQKMGK